MPVISGTQSQGEEENLKLYCWYNPQLCTNPTSELIKVSAMPTRQKRFFVTASGKRCYIQHIITATSWGLLLLFRMYFTWDWLHFAKAKKISVPSFSQALSQILFPEFSHVKQSIFFQKRKWNGYLWQYWELIRTWWLISRWYIPGYKWFFSFVVLSAWMSRVYLQQGLTWCLKKLNKYLSWRKKKEGSQNTVF